MIDQSEATVRSEERTYLNLKLLQGQIYEKELQTQEALNIWLETWGEVKTVVRECRFLLHVEELAQIAREKETNTVNNVSKVEDSTEDEGMYDDRPSQLGTLRSRVRAALEIEHVCVFFLATAYYQQKSNPKLTEPESEKFKNLESKEVEFYEQAKVIRKEVRLYFKG
jgi:E3 ubiquitin-protein ligase SHPRH